VKSGPSQPILFQNGNSPSYLKHQRTATFKKEKTRFRPGPDRVSGFRGDTIQDMENLNHRLTADRQQDLRRRSLKRRDAPCRKKSRDIKNRDHRTDPFNHPCFLIERSQGPFGLSGIFIAKIIDLTVRLCGIHIQHLLFLKMAALRDRHCRYYRRDHRQLSYKLPYIDCRLFSNHNRLPPFLALLPCVRLFMIMVAVRSHFHSLLHMY
jgi:hypothetical protein